jgi:glutathione S-transferase
LRLGYEHVPVTVDDPFLKSAEFLAISPNGTVPAIVDDGFALAESLAINLYLTKRYAPGSLYPATLAGEADAWRWSLWAQGQLEPWVMGDRRLADLHAATAVLARPEINRGLALLDRSLTGRAWLLDGGFTVADLNVSGVLSPSRSATLDLEPHPALAAWLARCYGRPAARAVRRRFAAA